ncbi:MAG TPA: hypothetical protein VN025_00870 [Candidatus Dormibacteraeota bacterium]|jgi:hypothetical protein|nr:hypothetical protein [Candidatus Dormibacteraeota bacterium]
MKKSLISFAVVLFCGGLVPKLSASPADDLTVTKKVTVNGAEFSTQSLLKGPRERSSMQMNGMLVSTNIRQCDLHRTLSVQDSTKSFLVRPDIDDTADTKDKKDSTAATATAGGTVTYRSTMKDTGEKKQILGYNARHLKITIATEPGPNACATNKTNYEIDGWYIDLKTVPGACQSFSPVSSSSGDTGGCMDKIVYKQNGSIKPGYAVQETMTIQNENAQPYTITTEVTNIQKGALDAALFDVPSDYRQVSTMAELRGVPANYAAAGQQPQTSQYSRENRPSAAQMINPITGPSTMMAMGQQANAQAAALYGQGGQMAMPNMQGMPGMGNQPSSQRVAAPQTLGPKQPGHIRIGVVTPDAQVGQGTSAGQDYGTPIRNAMIQLMSGPAVEITAIDSHIAIQIQAEGEQKQCDYLLYSSVVVKKPAKGGFGNFMKMAAPIASMAPMMGGGMTGAMAGSMASQAASVAAQQAAASQLGQFNGQIKSKDDVTVLYQLTAPGQQTPKTQNTLQAKAKADGEDVMTPLLTQLATTVLTEATKK